MTEDQQIRRICWNVLVEALGLTDGATLLLQAHSYTVLTLPSAATYTAGIIYVSNETGGATLAFSDGTNWRRVQDRNVVS